MLSKLPSAYAVAFALCVVGCYNTTTTTKVAFESLQEELPVRQKSMSLVELTCDEVRIADDDPIKCFCLNKVFKIRGRILSGEATVLDINAFWVPDPGESSSITSRPSPNPHTSCAMVAVVSGSNTAVDNGVLSTTLCQARQLESTDKAVTNKDISVEFRQKIPIPTTPGEYVFDIRLVPDRNPEPIVICRKRLLVN